MRSRVERRLRRIPLRRGDGRNAFSLVELLVSTALLVFLLSIVIGLMSNTSSLWIRHRNQTSAFESANAAFNLFTTSLSQAVLNTYWQVSGNEYARLSELHFIMGPSSDLIGPGANGDNFPGSAVFFQAPLGRVSSKSLSRLPSLVNNLGFFVQHGDNPDIPPFLDSLNIVPSRPRFRLFQWMQPTENLGVYETSAAQSSDDQRLWFRDEVKGGSNMAVLAENVIWLKLMAEYPVSGGGNAETSLYDSRDGSHPERHHQMPPRIRVLMAVIDETSAQRLADKYGDAPPPLAPAAGQFEDTSRLSDDMAEWEAQIKAVDPSINYRMFTTTVSIQNSAWSY